MRSIQFRLGSGLLISLMICFSALWFLVSISVEYLAEEYIASRIKHDTDSLVNIITIDNENNLVIDSTRINLIYNQPFSGHYFVITTDTQQINSRSLWDQNLKSIIAETGKQQRNHQTGPEQQSLLVISSGYNKQGKQFSISIAENLEPLKENIKKFQFWFAVIAFSMLFVLVVLQILILRGSLTPLRSTQAEIKALEQGHLNKLSTNTPIEIQPLINEVNHLLSVVEQRLHRSRDASSDLAHAIKKPLTVIQQLIEKNIVSDTTKELMLQQTNAIYQISDRILKRARLAGHGHGGALFSFSHDFSPLIQTLDMMYTDKSVSLISNIQENITCPIDREDMLELLGNLLDNAYKWSKQQVIITVSINSDIHICIEDDGPGAELDKITQLAKRGVRLDEQMEGHGFGLAITSDIVADYNGILHFSLSDELGGFRTDIKFPIPASNNS